MTMDSADAVTGVNNAAIPIAATHVAL